MSLYGFPLKYIYTAIGVIYLMWGGFNGNDVWHTLLFVSLVHSDHHSCLIITDEPNECISSFQNNIIVGDCIE